MARKRLRGDAALTPSIVARYDPVVLKGEAGRRAPHLAECLRLGRLARLDDDVAYTQLLDERHHLLLRTRADRQHRDDGRDAEDHAEHREQRAQLVDAEVVEAELQILEAGAELRLRSRNARITSRPVAAQAQRFLCPSPGQRGDCAAPLPCRRANRRSRHAFQSRSSTFTSRGSNERPCRTNTTGLPSCSKSAWRQQVFAQL